MPTLRRTGVGIAASEEIPATAGLKDDLKQMPFPIKTCVVCEEEFELKPGKPGFANRCPKCSAADEEEEETASDLDAGDREANEARRKAIRDLLYRKES
jgi:hypothetical protein